MRKLRHLIPGAEYHVTALINRGEFALEPDIIKELFLNIVSRAKEKYSFQIRNFVIMDNHVHLLVKPGKGESLSRIMQWILGVFARQYNRFYHTKGHVWYDRFKSKIIESYRQLVVTFKYISNNPVRASMVENPCEYVFGALWFIKHKRFKIVEPPDNKIKTTCQELFI